MDDVTMDTLPNDYLNDYLDTLIQKEHILDLLVQQGKVDLKEFHEELENEFGEGYDGWALEENPEW